METKRNEHTHTRTRTRTQSRTNQKGIVMLVRKVVDNIMTLM